MADLEARLFGVVSVRSRDRPVEFPSAKVLELFCHLLLNADRAQSRDSVCETLWPAGGSRSKGYLRQALWRLRNVLLTHSADAMLVIDAEWIRIDTSEHWWLDVDAFDRAYLAARDTPGHQLTDDRARELQAAVELYRGELMSTCYQDWCGYERDRRQRCHLVLLEQLMGWCEARELWPRGVDHGQLVLRHDPTRESAHRALMRLHHGAGDRPAALRQFRRCEAALRTELGIEPSAETAELHDRIRGGRPPDPPGAGVPAVLPHPRYDEIAGLHARLDQIQAGLAALHDAVRRHPVADQSLYP